MLRSLREALKHVEQVLRCLSLVLTKDSDMLNISRTCRISKSRRFRKSDRTFPDIRNILFPSRLKILLGPKIISKEDCGTKMSGNDAANQAYSENPNVSRNPKHRTFQKLRIPRPSWVPKKNKGRESLTNFIYWRICFKICPINFFPNLEHFNKLSILFFSRSWRV